MCVVKGNDVNEKHTLVHTGNSILRNSKKEIDVLIFNLVWVHVVHALKQLCIAITFDFHFEPFFSCASFAVTQVVQSNRLYIYI